MSLDVRQWKDRCIQVFKSGEATDAHWEQMADVMLVASEAGELQHDTDIESVIDPDFDKEPSSEQ